MSVEIKIPTINGITLNTANKYVKDNITLSVGIKHYDYTTTEDYETDLDKFLTGQISELTNNRITSVVANRCEMDKAITKIDLPNVLTIGSEAFKECTNLVEIKLPSVTNIAGSAFSLCTALEEVDLPNVTNWLIAAGRYISAAINNGFFFNFLR